ncbi:hypothetical protein [Neisseria shayeganii]|nr:hypothetical protein [Neisseria shayeganii]
MQHKLFSLLLLPLAAFTPAEAIPCGSASADIDAAFIFAARCVEVMSPAERQEVMDVMEAIQRQTDRCVRDKQQINTVPSPEGMNEALKMVLGNPVPRQRDTVLAECRQSTPMPVLRQRYRSLMPTP